jgi:GTP-binding protein
MANIDPKKIFSGKCEFIIGAHNYSQVLETNQPEIAFIGASNVGKSSLINAICNKKIAIVSNTPGRTRQLNFFLLSEGFNQNYSQGFMLVDMPGYGFAKAKDKDIEHWQKTAVEYLTKRSNLKRLFLLLDPIKGVKKNDLDIINILNATAVSFQIIFTKIDKISKNQLEEAEKIIKKEIARSPAAYPEIIKTSSSKGYGISDIQDEIIKILSTL